MGADDRYTAYNPQPGTEVDAGPLGYLALPLAWLVPGLGHLLIGQKARGIVFFVTIHLLFALGLLFGGIRSINPADQPIWTYTQFLTGWPMLVANYVEKNVFEPRYVLADARPGKPIVRSDGSRITEAENDYESGRPVDPAQWEAYAKDFIAKYPVFAFHPKIHDMGSVYCGIAGMLNLLVMFDVLLRVTGSERENPERKRDTPGTAGKPAGASA